MVADFNVRETARRAAGGRAVAGTALGAWALCLAVYSSAAAHGWHNGALATASLEEWIADVKGAIPDIEQRMGGAQLTSSRDPELLKARAAEAQATPQATGRTIESELTPQQRALLGRKANDCLQVIAYMNRKNIIPEEFPRFQLGKADQYRQAAKQLMKVMGPEGVRPLVGVIRNEMIGPGAAQGGLAPNPEFRKDLLEILKYGADAGYVTDEQLQALVGATQGKKSATQARFAKQVEETIFLLDKFDLATMADAVAETESFPLRKRLRAGLRKRLDEAQVIELLRAQLQVDDPRMRRMLAEKLRGKSPTYAEVETQLQEIWELAGCQNREVAAAARKQVVNAFQRAPISHCMRWLGRGDKELNTLIWEQLDGRIDRADSQRRAGYCRTGVAVLGHPQFDVAGRTAAIELLTRLGDRRAVGPLSDALPQLPRELWPKAGDLLRGLTGESYGPYAGDGAVEVFEAAGKWRAWWEENGGE